MKTTFTLLILLISLTSTGINAQYKYETNYDFLVKKQQIGKSGMIAYTSWSSVNMAGGIASWALGKGEVKYFGQMNVLWSAINLGIAIPGLLGSYKAVDANVPTGKMIKMQYSSEQTFLINGGLDFLYVGTGAFLRGIASKYPKHQDMLNGYGDSFLINGAFLLFFDFIQYFRHSHQRKNADNLFLDKISLSDTGIGLKYSFN
ncbi:MAG: hypothetical protein H3C31_09450 [Brumimicrobium sp.]|nr:hypothetical protein [Brumimicrobium sp.]